MKKNIFYILIVLFSFSIDTLLSNEVQQSNWKGKVEDREGVSFVINPKEPLYGEIELELAEDLKIGSEEDENFRFFKWISLDVDGDGNIYVLDRGSFRIQKFDKEGGYVQTIGREGQGPGEFDNPNFITLDEKGFIYVKDGARAHIFDRSGQFVKSFLVPLNSNDFKITSEGNFLGERLTIRPPDDLFEGVALMDDKNGLLKDIAKFPSIAMDSMFNRKDRFSIQVPELKFCPGIKDYAVYGFSSEYRLCVVDFKGDVYKIIEVNEPAEKISNKERQKIIDVIMSSLKSRSSARQEARADLEKKVLIPKSRPFFEEIRMDENGNIFAQKVTSYLSEEKGYEFDLFNEEGHYLYRLKVPALATNLKIIKYGYIFYAPYDEDIGYFQVKRYKIKNWDQIKKGSDYPLYVNLSNLSFEEK